MTCICTVGPKCITFCLTSASSYIFFFHLRNENVRLLTTTRDTCWKVPAPHDGSTHTDQWICFYYLDSLFFSIPKFVLYINGSAMRVLNYRHTHAHTHTGPILLPRLQTREVMTRMTILLCMVSGVEITKYFSLSFGKVAKNLPVRHYILPVLDMQTDSNFQNFSLSVVNFYLSGSIFTCPGQADSL